MRGGHSRERSRPAPDFGRGVVSFWRCWPSSEPHPRPARSELASTRGFVGVFRPARSLLDPERRGTIEVAIDFGA